MRKNTVRFDFVTFEQLTKFGRNPENRDIDSTKHRGHITNIKEMCRDSLATMPPIIVNAVTGNIVDGQTRTKALTELFNEGVIDRNTPIQIQYISVPKDEEITLIRKLCSGHKDWSVEDFIQSYFKGGSPDYKMLIEFCKNHMLTSSNGKLKFRYGAALLNPNYDRDSLKNGKLTVTEEDLEYGETVHQELCQILEVLDLLEKPKYWIESLAKVWQSYRDRYDFKTWLKVIKKRKDYIKKHSASNQKEWNEIFSCLITWKEKQDAKDYRLVAE